MQLACMERRQPGDRSLLACVLLMVYLVSVDGRARQNAGWAPQTHQGKHALSKIVGAAVSLRAHECRADCLTEAVLAAMRGNAAAGLPAGIMRPHHPGHALDQPLAMWWPCRYGVTDGAIVKASCLRPEGTPEPPSLPALTPVSGLSPCLSTTDATQARAALRSPSAPVAVPVSECQQIPTPWPADQPANAPSDCGQLHCQLNCIQSLQSCVLGHPHNTAPEPWPSAAAVRGSKKGVHCWGGAPTPLAEPGLVCRWCA